MRGTATWRLLGAAASLALVASLWLPWFHGEEDGGPYDETGWSSFDWTDIALAAGSGAALLCLAAIGPATRRLAIVPLIVGVVSSLFAAAEALVGHVDHNPTAAYPRAGLFLALACGLLLALAAQRLRTAFRAEPVAA